MQPLLDLLFAGTEALLWPVLIGLFAMACYAVFTLGAFAREAWSRRHVANPDLLDVQQIERLELRMSRAIDRDALVSRLGPMFGLAGTLIPLGPGLQQLHSGNLAGLGSQLAVAFSTTVVGLVVCAVCFLVSGVRGRWYEHDLRALERRRQGEEDHG